MIRAVVSFPKDERTRKPLYSVNWDKEYLDIPIITYSRQPAFTSEEVTKIVAKADGQSQILFALFAGAGIRVGEMCGLEIDKHISPDCSTIMISQSVYNGKIQIPKTPSANREVDLHPQLAQILKAFIGDRQSGFLFRSASGTPLSKTNLLRRHLHPILKRIGWSDPKTNDKKAGFHAFRRFRVTWLRKQRAPDDLLNFWIGHSSKTITSDYSMIKNDVKFRKEEAERLGLGFELPIKHPDVVPNASICTQNPELDEVA